jgi:hypothetical protein
MAFDNHIKAAVTADNTQFKRPGHSKVTVRRGRVKKAESTAIAVARCAASYRPWQTSMTNIRIFSLLGRPITRSLMRRRPKIAAQQPSSLP